MNCLWQQATSDIENSRTVANAKSFPNYSLERGRWRGWYWRRSWSFTTRFKQKLKTNCLTENFQNSIRIQEGFYFLFVEYLPTLLFDLFRCFGHYLFNYFNYSRYQQDILVLLLLLLLILFLYLNSTAKTITVNLSRSAESRNIHHRTGSLSAQDCSTHRLITD